MAHIVVLVSSEAEREELALQTRMVADYVQENSPRVHTSLSKRAVALAAKIYEETKFHWVPDHSWNLRMTETTLFDCQMLTNEEVHSFAQEMNATFADVDFEKFEDTEEFVARLKRSLFADSTEPVLVITEKNVIAACLELLSVGGDPPVFLELNVWPDSQRGTVVTFHDRWAGDEPEPQAAARLLNTLPVTESVVLPGSEVVHSDAENLKKLLEDRVTCMVEKYCERVGDAVQKTVADCTPQEVDPSQAAVAAVSQELRVLHEQYSKVLDSLSARLSADDFPKTQASEMSALVQSFRSIQQQARSAELQFTELVQSLEPRVVHLRDQLERVDSTHTQLQRDLELAKDRLTKGYPLSIASVRLGEDGSYYAIIKNRKFYDVYGDLCVMQGQFHVCQPIERISVKDEMEVNFTPLQYLAPGQYELCVLHFFDQREISRRVEFTLCENWRMPPKPASQYQDSLIYKNIDNMGEIEAAFAGKHNGDIDLFRRLVTGWRNETQERLSDVLRVLLESNEDNEVALRYQLCSQGFVIQT